jgi:hypothetical protein
MSMNFKKEKKGRRVSKLVARLLATTALKELRDSVFYNTNVNLINKSTIFLSGSVRAFFQDL